ncbi:MAG TPA: EAL domain-containing protein [Dermatophilaceae bacterium]
MTQPTTVLVLAQCTGGSFFGEVLVGLTREIRAIGGRVVLVQTLGPGTGPDDNLQWSDFSTPVAWAEVDGAITITIAVGGAYLQRLRDAGKPVVVACTRIDGFDAPLALPDNDNGTVAAVEHLIAHGHTRIGFVTIRNLSDSAERLASYRGTLQAHGLAADPTLVFTAPENSERGGAQAAHAVLAGPRPPSALMVAADATAIGLMRVLTDSGVAIPGDIAVMAFDNVEAGSFSTPTLSSVNQRFDEVGALAARLVLAQIRGEAVPYGPHSSPAAGLALRASCGCGPDELGGHQHDPVLGVPTPTRSRMCTELGELFGDTLVPHSTAGGPTQDAVLAIGAEIEDLLNGDDNVSVDRMKALTESLHRMAPDANVLHRTVSALTQYVERAGTSSAQLIDRSPVAAARVAAALWRMQAFSFRDQATSFEASLDEQIAVDRGLLEASHSDPRVLGWLIGTHVRAAALGLWEDGPSERRLRVVGSHDPRGLLPDLLGTTMTAEHFPPASLVEAAQAADRGLCVVVPVCTRARDWGLLAVVGEINTTYARVTYHHWAALLCASLEEERLQEVVRENALRDALTGLPNRRLFLEQLEHALSLWQRSRTPFAVLFLDLDGFKIINDSLGHQMGDRVLTAVGTRIARELRAVDTGARFGGDEFVILLADTDAGGALVVAQRVQVALAGVLDLDGHEISTRASLGIATSAIGYASAEDVLHDADTAMYRAKSAEPGTLAFFDAAMHANALHKQSMHAEIHRALQENQFEVHYQPIVNLASCRTDRFEALVRWRHPERGLVLPGEFLSVMAETGLIVRLGHWILDVVCRQLVTWGPGVVNVSINVSDDEFWHQDLLAQVLETLRRYDLPADRLTLEITEGVLMRRPEVALRIMRKMHDAGLRLHIDDFGTGYSSLETLHRFPVDAFKIDRSFLRSLTSVDRSAELISSLVALGNALDLAVVAEGVETAEQLTFLQEIGCAAGQGYLFMPAVAGDRATDLLGHSLHAQDSDMLSAQPARRAPPTVATE